MKESQKGAKFCPKCGSSNLTFAAFFKPSIWRCLDCGYEGAFVVEDSKPAKRFQGKLADTQERIRVPEFLNSTPAPYTPSPAVS
jgi:transposase-like protein